MRYAGLALAAAGLLVLATGEAWASAVIADRPSLSTGPEVLAPGLLQLEWGARYTGGTASIGSAAGFEVTQRFGLIPGLEFRTTLPVTLESTQTLSSLAMGVKAQFLEGYLLSVGALGGVEWSPRGNGAQAALLATLGLPANFSLTLNAGPVYEGAWDWMGTLLLGYDPKTLWQGFVELGRYQDPAGVGMGLAVDAGLSVLVSEDVVWDVAVLKGLTPEVPDWGVTSGVSLRWGK